MKRVLSLFLVPLLILSCTKEDSLFVNEENEVVKSDDLIESDIDLSEIDEVNIESLIFQDKVFDISEKYVSNISKTEKDQIQNEIDGILNLPNLTIYIDNSSTALLFENYEDYLKNEPISSKTNNTSLTDRSSYTPFVSVYANVNYDSFRYRRIFTSSNYTQGVDNGFGALWNTPYPSGGTWNDRAGSLIAGNCRVQFFRNSYSDPNGPGGATGQVTGQTLVIDDNNGDNRALGFSNLRRVRLSGSINWNDRISEYRVGRTY